MQASYIIAVMKQEYYTIKQIAELRGVKRQAVYEMLIRRKIMYSKFGRTIVIRKEDAGPLINPIDARRRNGA